MQLNTTEVAKMVSRAWKALPEDEREKWEEMARKDKARYEMEKSMYHGPWKVPCTKKGKDPNAPKRPMSAFLAFSNSKRSIVKRRVGDAKNSEISKILVQMWKDASEAEKKPYIDEEYRLRQQYKNAMADWKRRSEEEREERENEAMEALREGKQPATVVPSKRNGRNTIKRCPSADSTIETSNCGPRGSGEYQYSTKMAADTFAQAPSSSNQSLPTHDYNHHSYPSHPQSSYTSGTAPAAQPVPSAYSFSSTADNEYAHQHHHFQNPQGQFYPPASAYYPPGYYSPGGRQQQASSATADAYKNDSTATGYIDTRGGEAHQPSAATSSGSNRDPYYGNKDYGSVYNNNSGEGSNSSSSKTNSAIPGYDHSYYYGQPRSSQHHPPPPYYGYPGYDPSAAYYYQQGMLRDFFVSVLKLLVAIGSGERI